MPSPLGRIEDPPRICPVASCLGPQAVPGRIELRVVGSSTRTVPP